LCGCVSASGVPVLREERIESPSEVGERDERFGAEQTQRPRDRDRVRQRVRQTERERVRERERETERESERERDRESQRERERESEREREGVSERESQTAKRCIVWEDTCRCRRHAASGLPWHETEGAQKRYNCRMAAT